MCGINGIFSFSGNVDGLNKSVAKMNDALAHRGPDDDGVYFDELISLGHRRLSIIDLSSAGHQPMISENGRFVIVFNGEIYNFRKLRLRLNYPFKSNSDSEVLLACWQEWGVDCIERLIGMFAFAVWDKVENELHIVRDRLGIKPLYYYLDDENIVFSSEIRAVLASEKVARKLSQEGLIDYLRYQCVHQPNTIVDGVKLLPSGHVMRISQSKVEINEYWSPMPKEKPKALTYEETKQEVYNRLLAAVERRLVADVPFAAFLSGGIDSSAIVALMSKVTDKIDTFSISFAEENFSEARYARIISDMYKTNHHEIQLSPDDFLKLLPEALDAMDHPSGDGPNTYVVSKVTKEAGITMALSGLGGDELFAGYPVFNKGKSLSNLSFLNVISHSNRSKIANFILPRVKDIRLKKMAVIFGKSSISMYEAYPVYRQVFLDDQIKKIVAKEELVANSIEKKLSMMSADEKFDNLPDLSKISLAEIESYMKHVLLRDTDQMSMAHALEVRVPFLDHELVEFVLGVNDEYKYPCTPKKLLVESLGDLLPDEIVNRQKMGFTLPFSRWMKYELRDFCLDRLVRLSKRSEFDEFVVMQYWNDFVNDVPSITWSRIWMLVVLEHWLDRNNIN